MFFLEEREFILRIFYQFDVIELAGSSEEGEKVFDQETIDFIVELNLKGSRRNRDDSTSLQISSKT